MIYSSKTASRRAKRSKMLDSETLVTHVTRTFDLISNFGLIRCTNLKVACNSQLNCPKVKQIGILHSVIPVKHIGAAFDLLGVNISLAHSVHSSEMHSVHCHIYCCRQARC